MSSDGSMQIVCLDDLARRADSASRVRCAQNAPLHDVREYLAGRVCLMREQLDVLRAADGASGKFSSFISLLETTLEQAAGAADRVMNDVDAIAAIASESEKINLASTLVGAVARSYKMAILREQKLTGDSLTQCNHSVIWAETGMAAGNGGATNLSSAPTANSTLP